MLSFNSIVALPLAAWRYFFGVSRPVRDFVEQMDSAPEALHLMVVQMGDAAGPLVLLQGTDADRRLGYPVWSQNLRLVMGPSALYLLKGRGEGERIRLNRREHLLLLTAINHWLNQRGSQAVPA